MENELEFGAMKTYTIHTCILLLIGSITQDVYLIGSSKSFYHVKYFFWLLKLETLNSEEIIRNFITQHTQNLVGLHNEAYIPTYNLQL